MYIEQEIMELDNIKTFWEDVKKLVGYYEGRDWKDWQIKHFQAVADERYEQLKNLKNV